MLSIDLNTSWTVLVPVALIAIAAWRWGGWRRS
jgi:hypothetical protein